MLFVVAVVAALQPLTPARAPVPVASAAASYDIAAVKGTDSSLQLASSFFVDAFWQQGTTVSSVELSEAEREQLVSQQFDDMQARYGELVGKRRLQSRLVIARGASGAIAGCVGVEMALIQPQSGEVLSRTKGEGILNQELSSMGARERGQYRKMDAVALTAALFPEYQVYALLANLAVAPETRRTGLARSLCDQCVTAGIDWGVQAVMLQVEEKNEPARKLYESVGYQLVHRDEAATAMRVQAGAGASDGLLRGEVSTTLLMGKGIVA